MTPPLFDSPSSYPYPVEPPRRNRGARDTPPDIEKIELRTEVAELKERLSASKRRSSLRRMAHHSSMKAFRKERLAWAGVVAILANIVVFYNSANVILMILLIAIQLPIFAYLAQKVGLEDLGALFDRIAARARGWFVGM